MSPGAIRIGTPAVTSRGMKENDVEQIVDFIDEVIQLSIEVSKTSGKTIKEFIEEFSKKKEVEDIKKRVIEFSIKFKMPGKREN